MAHRGKNEGSISKRENGLYRAQVTIISHLGNPSNQSISIKLSRLFTFRPDNPLSAKIRCNTCTLPTQWTISLPFLGFSW